jgi:hypothetical protein
VLSFGCCLFCSRFALTACYCDHHPACHPAADVCRAAYSTAQKNESNLALLLAKFDLNCEQERKPAGFGAVCSTNQAKSSLLRSQPSTKRPKRANCLFYNSLFTVVVLIGLSCNFEWLFGRSCEWDGRRSPSAPPASDKRGSGEIDSSWQGRIKH